ncbi:MAG: hypothetical protein WAN48_12800 [Actinomycetes bacterium]
MTPTGRAEASGAAVLRRNRLRSLAGRSGWKVRLLVTVGCWWVFAGLVWWRAVAQPGGPWTPTTSSAPYRFALLQLLLLVPWALTLHALRDQRRIAAAAVFVAWGAVALPLLLAPPMQSHDVFQYAVYGHMQSGHDLNPFVTSPASGDGTWLGFASWPSTTAVYGPLWLMVVDVLAGWAGGSVVAAVLMIKVLTVILLGLAGWGLLSLRADPVAGVAEGSAATVAFLLLNPLVVTAVVLGGHLDAVLVAAFVAAMVADQRRRPLLSVACLVAACLVKVYAAPVLAVYLLALWRRGNRRKAVAGGAIAVVASVVAYAPYWASAATFQALIDAGGMADHSLAGVLGLHLVGLVLPLAVGIVLVFHPVTVTRTWWAAAVLLGSFFLATSWFLPWYLVGLVALVAPLTDERLRRAVAVATGTSFIGLPPGWLALQTALRYLPVWVAWRWPVRTVRVDSNR